MKSYTGGLTGVWVFERIRSLIGWLSDELINWNFVFGLITRWSPPRRHSFAPLIITDAKSFSHFRTRTWKSLSGFESGSELDWGSRWIAKQSINLDSLDASKLTPRIPFPIAAESAARELNNIAESNKQSYLRISSFRIEESCSSDAHNIWFPESVMYSECKKPKICMWRLIKITKYVPPLLCLFPS